MYRAQYQQTNKQTTCVTPQKTVLQNLTLAQPVKKFSAMLVSGFHHASLLSVTIIDQLMHSIITVVDIKILLYARLKDTH